MPLLERENQLGLLDALLRACDTGCGGVALVTGEAGAGKTSLIEAFATRKAGAARFLRSACEDLSIPEPLGPLYDLARHAGWDLMRLEQGAPRLRLFAEALNVFEASEGTTVLVIEDLHWADDATLDFVRYLGRRIAATRLLLLLTGRNEASEGQRRMRRALSEVPSDVVRRIDVPLLSEEAVKKLAAATGRTADAVYRATAGNAFFVAELLHADQTEALPPTVRDAVLARAERLSPEARAALDAVSVFPRRAEAGALSHLLGRSGDEQLAECVASGILDLADGRYAFRHEIARCAIHAGLPELVRVDLNRRALLGLHMLPEISAARLVHHAVEAGDVEAVRALAPAAAEDASRHAAHHEAADLLRAALAVAQDAAPLARANLLERLGFESHLIGRMPEALDAARQAREIHALLGNRIREGDCLRWLSRFSYLAGDRVGADAFGDAAVQTLETEPPGAELAMALSNLSHLAMLADRPEPTLAHGTKAIALAEELARPDIVCHALNNIGTVLHWIDPPRAREHLRTSLDMAISADLQEHAARAFTNRAWIEINLLDRRTAGDVLREGIEYCIERDLDTWRDYMRGWQAELLLREGRWDDAADVARLVLDNQQATPLARYPAGLALARLRLRRGDPIGELIEELAGFLLRGKELQRLAPYATLMAEQAWISGGDPAPALKLLDEAISMLPRPTAQRELFYWRRQLGADSGVDGAAGVGAETVAAPDAPFERGLHLLSGDEAARREALAVFTGLGANAVVQRVRQQLRGQGVRRLPRGPYGAARQNRAGLTMRQLEVLRLIERGLSNKAIATSLAISPKTVDHHVSAVLQKLAAGSRGEAVAAARGVGLFY